MTEPLTDEELEALRQRVERSELRAEISGSVKFLAPQVHYTWATDAADDLILRNEGGLQDQHGRLDVAEIRHRLGQFATKYPMVTRPRPGPRT